jgi:hypothetical protein
LKISIKYLYGDRKEGKTNEMHEEEEEEDRRRKKYVSRSTCGPRAPRQNSLISQICVLKPPAQQ